MHMLELSMALSIKVQNGGLFVSRGTGRHPARKLDSWEIIFVEKGMLTIQEEDRIFEVGPGESLLLWPNRRHVGTRDFPPDLRFYWIHFEMTENHLYYPGATRLALAQHCQADDPQNIISLFRLFLSEQERFQRTTALELVLLLILQQIMLAGRHNKRLNEAEGSLAWKAEHLIKTRFHLPLSTSQLAKALHCNADYLGRVYRRVFHLTLTEAIHRQRVRAAENLLLSNSVSLTEVAMQCGFKDVGYFRKIFRKYTGLTPAVWKRRYYKEHVNSG